MKNPADFSNKCILVASRKDNCYTINASRKDNCYTINLELYEI